MSSNINHNNNSDPYKSCNIFKIFSFKKNLKRVFWYSIFRNNNNKSTKIAIKMEKIEKNSSEIETRRLLYLQRDGIPKIYCYGNNQTHNILIQCIKLFFN